MLIISPKAEKFARSICPVDQVDLFLKIQPAEGVWLPSTGPLSVEQLFLIEDAASI
jgi:hypothetical protein